MEKNYSNWLLVSDIDGTLNTKSMKLPEVNKEAVSDFVGNLGNFTLCSGRNLESLAIHYKKLGISSPAIFLNGAGIYDFLSKNIIHFDPITEEGENIIIDIIKSHKALQLTVFAPEKIYLGTIKCLYGLVISKMDGLNFQLCKTLDDIPRGIWGKASVFGTKKSINKLEERIKSFGILDCFKTSPFTLEIVNAGVNKGAAVMKLAEILKVNQSNTAAVGDYYNDVDMLKRVAHPVCCGQAPDDIKAISEYVTCHCNDGAVADFSNYIKTNYIK